MKKILICVLLLLMLQPDIIHAYQSTDKLKVPFEIQSIQAQENGFMIEGWGMISSVQHFKDSTTHHYQLILSDNKGETLFYDGIIKQNDQTEVMQVMNVGRCGDDELFKDGKICYYDYQNVGFEFFIPYADLQLNHQYVASLKIEGITSGTTYTTQLFYPTTIPVHKKIDKLEYKAISALIDTKLKVVYDHVLERQEPANKYSYRMSNNLCSSTYGYYTYYQPDSIYEHVYGKYQANGTTYYNVHTSASAVCLNDKNTTVEGNDYSSWIAGNFVDYIGEPLTFTVTSDNEPPQITILENPIIYVDEVIRPLDYAVAFDKEDGDITDNIVIIDGEVLPVPGIYEITFYVEDSMQAYDIKKMQVTVAERENKPPAIYAADKVIYQYEPFDYLADVDAFDYEDGIITGSIWYEGYVDVETLGDYYVTYYAIDCEGLITSKVIHVLVIRNPREKIRYIDALRPFYMEPIPRNWEKRYMFLFDQLEHPQKIAESIFTLK